MSNDPTTGKPESFQEFVCDSPGLTMDGIKVDEINNAHGQHYWKATQQIGTIFGFEVDGEISAIGRSREEVLQRLDNERKRLAESLWY